MKQTISLIAITLVFAVAYSTIAVPYDCPYAMETLKEMVLPTDLQVPTPWVAAATVIPGQQNDGYVEVDWMKLLDLSNNSLVVNELHYDNSGSVPSGLGGLYNRWFTSDVHNDMTNGYISNGLLHINVGSMPDNVSHWWLPRVWGIPGHRYALQMRVKIHGFIGIQLGCDYWGNLTDVDFNFQREAWLSDWYGDTNGEFIEITSPLPDSERIWFDSSDYGFYTNGEFYISKRMMECLGAEEVYLKQYSTPMVLEGDYYRYYTNETIYSLHTYWFYIPNPLCNRTLYIPHAVIGHLKYPADAVDNNLGGYNFYTTPTLRTPLLAINKSPTGVVLSWNTIAGASYYKIWTKSTPNGSEAWNHVASTSSRTYTYSGADQKRFYRVTAH
ncbi:MAG: hypothetical protein PHO32_01300 [Candidatus Cloacimonetes bacterium]|nr:hypothetical protein [Candidatus Cloacimonadota bacterium]